jgi:sugar phosphate isomerase/epimerase
MKELKLSLQMFTICDLFNENPENALKVASEIGFKAVEFYSYRNVTDAEHLRQWLDKYGLTCSGINVNWSYFQPDTIDQTISDCKILGTDRIAIGSAPAEDLGKRSKMPEIFKVLKFAYEKAKEKDIKIGYHAHNTDFLMVDGLSVWDRIFMEMPQDFLMIPDTGNMASGMGNCMHYLEEYPGRTPWIHIKPFHHKLGTATMFGEDSFDWNALLKLAIEKGGADTAVIEYSYFARKTTVENARDCFNAVNEILQNL